VRLFVGRVLCVGWQCHPASGCTLSFYEHASKAIRTKRSYSGLGDFEMAAGSKHEPINLDDR